MSIVRSGIHLPLETAANELIAASLKGVTSQQAKADILTPWKENDRRSREVLTASGSPDAQIRRGMYHRAANRTKPYLNSREGVAPALRLLMTGGTGTMSMGGHSPEEDE
jgi:hypothetical protein